MSYTIPTTEPSEARVGNSLKWKKYLADYPPATWTLTYVLVKNGAQITITASNNGDGYHLVNVAPATTANYEAGVYKFQSYVENGTDRHEVASGTIELIASFTAGASDTRSHVKKTLDALEAIIEDRASLDQQSYSIGGRSLSRMSVDELLKWRDKYRAEYKRELNAERIKQGLGTKARVRVRF